MLPKLHKSKRHNEIIQKRQCAYINTKGNITVEACPIVAGPIHLTRGISVNTDMPKHCPTGPTLRACDIK